MKHYTSYISVIVVRKNKEDNTAPRYKVTLTKEERLELEAISTKGKRTVRSVLHTHALLLLYSGKNGTKWLIEKVAEAVGTTTRSLEHLKKRFAEEGLSVAIERK